MRRFALTLAPFLFACHGTVDMPVTMQPAFEKTALDPVPQGAIVENPALSGAADLVRDEWGIPHIYGKSLSDVTFAQGYVMAQDRWVQMDLARHKADGSLGAIVGALAPAVINGDIQMRVHHLRPTSQASWDQLRTSTDAGDVALAKALTSFTAGVNQYLSELKSGQQTLAPELAFLYLPASAETWTEVDSILLGQLQAFSLAFDADSEIQRSQIEAAAQVMFDQSKDPALSARKGLGRDLEILAPLDPTHTIDGGWTGMNGDSSTASLPGVPAEVDGNRLALLSAARESVRDIGNDHILHPSRGSNNWVIGPQLSATGHTLVANDTHLGLGNPATFYLVHLSVTGDKPTDVMGVQFPGIPGVILGMNQHVAWGATVNYIDVTDVYSETVVACDGSSDPCVMFNGKKVPLVPRKETFKIGKYGMVTKTLEVTLYDVPHHGPIIPRVTAFHTVEPLGQTELSIRYTGYEPAQLLRAVWGVDNAKTVMEAKASLDRDFKYGGQNWVLGDDQGNFGWTQTIRVPRRQKGYAPYKVMPGDGTAEWGADLDPKYIPHAWNPTKGYIATANNDPIGVTDDGEPFFDEPVVDGAPLYLGADYDPGTRVGRITKRIDAMIKAGKKIAPQDVQSIQADAVTEWGQALAPVLIDAATALAEEIAQPGSHPELATVAKGASDFTKAALPNLLPVLSGWSFDTPSATDAEKPSATEVRDSQATLVSMAWMARFADRALGDELAKLGSRPNEDFIAKLLVRMSLHPDLLVSGISKATGDSILFDDLGTPEVEGKRRIAAQALSDTLDYLQKKLGKDATAWRWGLLHTLTLQFPAGIAALDIPKTTEKGLENGFPRHGSNGTVDVGSFGLALDDFTYTEGPAIRFVADLDPTGIKGKNALPGGESFDPKSSHYRDQMEPWRVNQTFDLAFQDADVIGSANKEYAARMAAAASGTDDGNRPAGRIRFQAPAAPQILPHSH